ncbi:hypothetical protein [Maliponia aquimaris]|uniref:Uncharacterized protein n=1 Tax=Maliponia aquimaris TaxID=1673631 RepID=A0A238KH68_9RHOB|nr:hypothetical protein [Maliponia aquimaris]SMX41934.1 hypothetical protein MAA8898_02489 [Maliponia aquimaris]
MLGRLALAALVPLAGASVLTCAAAAPARADSHGAAQTPDETATARADLRDKAVTMQAQLALIVAELDAEIATQEDAAGFGASEEVLAQIDSLKARRDSFADQLAQVRALIADLDRAQ